MPTLDTLLEFSHHHCVAICAVLVPLNLLATLQTLVLVGLAAHQNPVNKAPFLKQYRPWGSIALAISLAGLLCLHVLSWLWVGVIMPPTYILFSLALVCLGLNGWALLQPAHLGHVLTWVLRKGLSWLRVATA
jgi:hypothetical protein